MLKILLIIFLLISNSQAAEQGELDDTSIGYIDINININPLVRISGLDDLDFGEWSGHGDMIEYDTLCIYSNDTENNASYGITPTIEGGRNSFEVRNGNRYIPFNLYWNNSDLGINGQEIIMHYNTRLSNLTNFNNEYDDCNNQDNASIIIEFLENNLSSASVDNYNATLILTLSMD